ncbi:hypothetical protein [Nisaea nitritireducens]|uniref:hypothetical protein n=1 Tax=Nisaea nitritireducens TaxID=568392 RepID=UPI00186840E5|nr:hypothetical protein [Nisaea nitritireducens]
MKRNQISEEYIISILEEQKAGQRTADVPHRNGRGNALGKRDQFPGVPGALGMEPGDRR